MAAATRLHRVVHNKFGTGMRADQPDFRDRYFKDTKYKAGLSIDDTVDWRNRIGMCWDQGEIGSCVAHGVGSLIIYVYPELMPSRLKIYYDGRAIEKTTRIDSGLEIRDGVKATVKDGVCQEAMWPYDVAKFKRKPPAKCYSTKNEKLITEYARVGKSNKDSDILDEMLNCLQQGSPIVFGSMLYESFESDSVAQTGIVPMPNTREKSIGGHCLAAYGFNKSKKTFIVRNSWGVDWGDNGYCHMPFDYLINNDLTSDLWMITR